MKYTPTEQQQTILDTVATNIEGRVVTIRARSGCTKTSTSRLIVNTLKPKKTLYFAFNKAIVEEGKEVFPPSVECKTLHALAYKYIQPGKVESFTYLCIKEKLSYPHKLEILNVVDEFFRSASVDMYEYFEEYLTSEQAEIAAKYVEKMLDDEMPKPFNLLLKELHIHLYTGEIVIDGYDLVLLDEAADTTAVAVEIFKLIKSPKKVMLGDPLQSIYGFMNLVDGFVLVDNPIELSLTKSFRCSTDIADRTRTFVKKNLLKSFEFEGFDRPSEDNSIMYISATNSQLVRKMKDLMQEGINFKLLRDVKDIFAPTLALATASMGKEVYHKKYKFLEKEYRNYTMSRYKNFFSYIKKEVQDEEIHSAIDTISSFNESNINIFSVLKEVKAMKPNPNVTLCTGFTAKGLEVDRVCILDDLNTKVNKIVMSGGPKDDNDYTVLKLAYVALTRARFFISNCKFA